MFATEYTLNNALVDIESHSCMFSRLFCYLLNRLIPAKTAYLGRSLFWLAIFASVSCNQTPLSPETIIETAVPLWSNPLPTPDYVDGLVTWQGNFVSRLCLSINEPKIWEPGEYGIETYYRVQRSTRVEVDGVLVRDVTFPQLGPAIARFDSQNNVIGTHGGGIEICFDVGNLADGFHVAIVTFHTKSGTTLGYTWAFKTKIKVGQVVPELPAIP